MSVGAIAEKAKYKQCVMVIRAPPSTRGRQPACTRKLIGMEFTAEARLGLSLSWGFRCCKRKGRAGSALPHRMSPPPRRSGCSPAEPYLPGGQRQDSTQESSADRAQTNNRGRPGKQSTLNKTDFCLDNGVHLNRRYLFSG